MGAGSAMTMVPLLEAGAAGAMPTIAACTPQGVYEAFAAFKDGDPALAAEKQSRLAEADALLTKLGIAGVKYGCDWNGYYGGSPRLPRVPLTAAERSGVEQVLSGLRN
jgi:dihydrodipicolinate synthase/N-acetylneuraminate lyase